MNPRWLIVLVMLASCKRVVSVMGEKSAEDASPNVYVVEPPKAVSSSTMKMSIVVHESGTITMNGLDVKDAHELADRARDYVKKTGITPPAVITADKSVVYARVIEVMDALRSAGIDELSFAPSPS